MDLAFSQGKSCRGNTVKNRGRGLYKIEVKIAKIEGGKRKNIEENNYEIEREL